MAENRVRYAVIGTEGIGKNHIRGIKENPKTSVLTAVCDSVEAFAKKAAEQNGRDKWYTDYTVNVTIKSAAYEAQMNAQAAQTFGNALNDFKQLTIPDFANQEERELARANDLTPYDTDGKPASLPQHLFMAE
jgi:hypothetical protein